MQVILVVINTPVRILNKCLRLRLTIPHMLDRRWFIFKLFYRVFKLFIFVICDFEIDYQLLDPLGGVLKVCFKLYDRRLKLCNRFILFVH
jgi:hypothetical protein